MNCMNEKIKVTKLDAAKRQLETSVRIYFSNGDPVSIHTLAAAAYNIIRDVNKKRGGKPMLLKEELIDTYVKPEYQKLMREKINKSENFFKHADLDHEDNIDFSPRETELFMLDAISHYYSLTGEDPPFFKIYRFWYMINNAQMFNLPNEIQNIMQGHDAEYMKLLGKNGYYNSVLPFVMRYDT